MASSSSSVVDGCEAVDDDVMLPEAGKAVPSTSSENHVNLRAAETVSAAASGEDEELRLLEGDDDC
eukprot:CAMPEP_0119558038 /NCGR_PEP_ID=MMETSP1352-20130426/9916_1 /TAXON_ID=265584 /ORGANISM="Stauroneis constricta, Strain CCMP1120" /LENGTH=65 /DNA_ID=CAMNT_0007605253 /DNA_START=91 /DNA_END=288 /DNA_ORIENTATION=-